MKTETIVVIVGALIILYLLHRNTVTQLHTQTQNAVGTSGCLPPTKTIASGICQPKIITVAPNNIIPTVVTKPLSTGSICNIPKVYQCKNICELQNITYKLPQQQLNGKIACCCFPVTCKPKPVLEPVSCAPQVFCNPVSCVQLPICNAPSPAPLECMPQPICTCVTKQSNCVPVQTNCCMQPSQWRYIEPSMIGACDCFIVDSPCYIQQKGL